MIVNGYTIKPRADLSGAYLSNTNLSGANLSNTNLRNADLSNTNLSNTNLNNTNLNGTYLNNANLNNANLSGAYLSGAAAIDAGQDSRGYRFVAVPHNDGLRILAGCRWYTLAQAREHWGEPYIHADLAVRAECLAKLVLIETVATAKGWTL